MPRRDYVSFLGQRHRDFGYQDRGPDPARWLWLIGGVALIAVSIFWFGFREVDQVAEGERGIDDTTIPTLLLPSGVSEDTDEVALESLECHTTVEQWSTFQAGTERQGCVSVPRIETPRIMWRYEAGISGWLNNPVIDDGAVFVGSAGVAQFSGDRLDGIHSIDLATGNRRWFYTTELDVNSVSVRNDVVVATGDEGRIWALSARDGTLLWTDDLQVGVFGSPLMLDDMIIIGAGDGSITPYDYDGNRLSWQRRVDGPIRGGASSDGERIYVAGETHEVLALTKNGEQVWRVQVVARGAGADEARIFAAPTVTEDLVIISLVRADVFGEPALVALDKDTGEVVWRSVDRAALKAGDWANIRSSPAVAGDFLVYAEGYSNELVVLGLASGETEWSAAVGPFCYPHWPSVAINGGYAYVARHDGGLYAVDLADRSGEFAWEIYIGLSNGSGAFPEGHQCDWGPETGHSILASPAVSPEGVVVVGSLEGWIMAIGDTSW